MAIAPYDYCSYALKAYPYVLDARLRAAGIKNCAPPDQDKTLEINSINTHTHSSNNINDSNILVVIVASRTAPRQTKMTRCDTLQQWYATLRYATLRYAVAWRGVAWLGLAWRGVAWHGMAWYDVV